ncbi:MAG: hypothetical protein M1814_001555 [Vezdaea aestivalis]|nr:MAG: hypothetical protein M1814_001555 [Vezdaea aestivalis]
MSTASLRSTSSSSPVSHSTGEPASHDAISPSTSITPVVGERSLTANHDASTSSTSSAIAVIGDNSTPVPIPTVRPPTSAQSIDSLLSHWVALSKPSSAGNDVNSSSSSTINGDLSFLNANPRTFPPNARRSKSGKLHILPPFISPVDSPAEAPSTPNEVHFNRMAEDGDAQLETDEGDRNGHHIWHDQPGRETPWSLIANEAEGRSQHAGQVEKSIAASLTNAEPAARSRKTSHSLGLFKENTTGKDHKRREDRRDKPNKDRILDSVDEQVRDGQMFSSDDRPMIVRQTYSPHHRISGRTDATTLLLNSKNQPSRSRRGEIARDQEAFESQPHSRHPTSKNELKSMDESGNHVALSHPKALEATNPQRQHSSNIKHIPSQLLAEIRAQKGPMSYIEPGSPISRSLPTTSSEMSKRDANAAHRAADSQSCSKKTGAVDDHAEEPDDEGEDSEHDEIASALYIPHQTPKIDADSNMDTSQLESENLKNYDQIHSEGSDETQNFALAKTSYEVDISLQQDGTKSYLHGDLHPSAEAKVEGKPAIVSKGSEVLYSTASETEYESLDEIGKTKKDETSLTDDFDLAFTATPMSLAPIKRHKPRPPIHSQPQDLTLVPLNAVELKPYKHQVGGHTTVFRFSRRAVCKPMSNRENEFYETIERQHPELLVFLPRYIGVLNVTFKKSTKRKKKKGKSSPGKGQEAKVKLDHSERADQLSQETHRNSASPSHLQSPSQPRLVSHSQLTLPTPRVVFENNRHIIPENLFGTPPEFFTSGPSLPSTPGEPRQTFRPQNVSLGSTTRAGELSRPPLEKHHHPSWGATSVNHQLQAQVLREVFSSPTIRHNAHHKYSRSHISVPHSRSDVADLGGNQNGLGGVSNFRRCSVDLLPPANADVSFENPNNPLLGLNRGLGIQSKLSQADVSTESLVSVEGQRKSSPSARTSPTPKKLRRRHSGMGLRRRRLTVDGSDKGELQYYEDDGYGGDGEDGLFAMDEEPLAQDEEKLPNGSSTMASPDLFNSEGSALSRTISDPVPDPLPMASLELTQSLKAAEPQSDGRVEHFLLLEDVTSDMRRPCVLDLKMGTRQYGLDANEIKQLSQRNKAANTTSGKLGVRICGMQVWNAKEELFSYQDKYYGRDLQQGMEFQAALTRFFYNGLNYDNIVASIPILLDKIKGLEVKIKSLRGYRFYASSLLLLYDGFPEHESARSESTIHSQEGHTEPEKEKPSIAVKIVDFANCVTAEDIIPDDVLCPPKDPNGIDKGFLRGLKNLRLYLYRIWADTKAVREKGLPDLDESEGPPQPMDPYTDPAGQGSDNDVSD